MRLETGFDVMEMVANLSQIAARSAGRRIRSGPSADGNVAIVGGLAGDGGAGAASVFTRSGGNLDASEKVVSAGAVGTFSPSVALSADGSVVLLGGANDNGGVGAAWTFTQAPVTGFRSKSWLAPAKQESPRPLFRCHLRTA